MNVLFFKEYLPCLDSFVLGDVLGIKHHIFIKATPHNPWLSPLHVICLPAFRHITQILLDLRQQACVEFRQSDENLDGASDAQGLCGIAIINMR